MMILWQKGELAKDARFISARLAFSAVNEFFQ